MDPDPSSPTPRRVKFAPKAPPHKPPKSAAEKINIAADDDFNDDEAVQQTLLRRIEDLQRRRPKVEKKSPVQVVFSHGATSSTIRSFSKQMQTVNDTSEPVHEKESALDGAKINFIAPSTAGSEIGPAVGETSMDSTDASIVKMKSDYVEPWDYEQSNYPVTLPLRRPYSGDPELLDEAEFEKDQVYDENALCSSRVLGFLDQDDSPSMILFQFPGNLPLDRKSNNASSRVMADNLKVLEEKSVNNQKKMVGSPSPSGGFSAKGKDIAGSDPQFSGVSTGTKCKEIYGNPSDSGSECNSRRGFSLEELPEGYMGKMLVYKSGTVKLMLGGVLYDVSPGSDCIFSQNVMSINASDRHCCELGTPTKRAVVSPDIDSLLENVVDSR